MLAHLYSLNGFHILFYELQFNPCSSTTIPGSIIYNFIILSLKYYNVTLSARIRPYSIMYCTLSRDGALQFHQKVVNEVEEDILEDHSSEEEEAEFVSDEDTDVGY